MVGLWPSKGHGSLRSVLEMLRTVRGPAWAWVAGAGATVFGLVCLVVAWRVSSAGMALLAGSVAVLVGFLPGVYDLLWAASSVRVDDRELVVRNHFRAVHVVLEDVEVVDFEFEELPWPIRIINVKRCRGVGVVRTNQGDRVAMIATAAMGRGRDFVGTQFESEARAKTELIAALLQDSRHRSERR